MIHPDTVSNCISSGINSANTAPKLKGLGKRGPFSGGKRSLNGGEKPYQKEERFDKLLSFGKLF